MGEETGRLESKLGFDRVREMVSNRCSTEYAVDRVAEEVFCTDPAEIRHRLTLTDEMRLILMFEENFPTGGYIDTLGFLVPLESSGYSIDVLSLGKLKTMLDTVRKITNFFSSIKDGIYPELKKMASPVPVFPEVLRRIDIILDKYGEVRDGASEELFRIRKGIKEKESAISKRASALLKKAQDEGIVEADASLSVRDGKLLIPVSTANKRKVAGYVYDESASGKTTFIEPAEVVELENQINELRFEEGREIARILAEFSDFVRPYVPEIQTAARFLGEVDFIMAKAQVALDFKAGMPLVAEGMEMNLRKARHPLLERALRKEGKEMVPQTVRLTPEKRILLISGPNAGGKSVCLKTVGLLQYMFQWGMPIPTSETSEIPVFDRIMVSIGDDQSIDNDLSTYSSFLAEMKKMLSLADGKTLVLIDEFGSGTEPAAGGAIAEAILSELDSRGVYGVITTHYTNLKLYAAGSGTGVINGAMQFDERNIAPLFQLEIGLPGNSFAFEMARKMGLPESVVKDAETKAGEGYVGIERNLRRIARNRRVLEERLQKIKTTDKALEGITEKYQKELEDIKKLRKDILDSARKEAEEIVKGANSKVEKTIRTIREAQAEKEKTKEARTELQGFISAIQEKKEKEQKNHDDYIERKIRQLSERKEKERARKIRRGEAVPEEEPVIAAELRGGPLKVGEKVRIKDSGMVGEVSRVSSKAVTVIVGNLTTSVLPSKVERISSNEFKSATKDIASRPLQKVDVNITRRKLEFKPELDIRGERLSDALDIVTRFIDDAIMLDIGSVRIITGKGTGVLHDEVQKYVKTIPGVAQVRDEDLRLGGSGVTVVTFG
ncbi:MAG: Smr/MutS family protein [Bacteroidales bacterium]|nr:Smr/MutS family protein [Bacteroidales bacterium]MBQ4305406.1 Smr/MutS family protein [Bacteroidales bacterium]